ncbi:alginate lyase [Halioglobus maricola]|uniref:Alginate lyase n=1 Tax=Halioglobus maricola TaxID=2601894 RepID=A0A5P9NPI1_9GAMM|nr:alginate lyase [Halioglobus maricola]
MRLTWWPVLAALLSIVSASAFAEERLVSDQQEYREAVAKLEPGDVVVLANGIWEDFEIVFEGKGTESRPITLTAQDKGKVVISGQSNLQLAGEYLVVSGLVFKNGYTPTDAVISFRKGKSAFANHSRVTETVIDGFSNPERFETDYWVGIYGKHNRFDHNHLEGKGNKGVLLAVRMNTPESQENHHRIDHNYFGPRSTLGSNGGETLRIGTSHHSLTDSFTRVENNYFDRCDGEVEIISVKAGKNQVRGNVFFESRGTLTLRHGNDNVVEDNIFFGNGVDHTGGIRVINKRQTIRNNYLEGLTGYRFGGGLVVMNGVPDSPINRYHQVDGALIENNSLVNVEHIQLAAGSDSERSAVPINSAFKANLIYSENGRDTFTLYDDVSGIEFAGNVLNEVKDPQLATGFESQSVKMKRGKNGLLYPTSKALANVGAKRDLAVLDKSDTGVSWYPKNDSRIRFRTGKTIDVEAAPGALKSAVARAEAGDVLRLAAGEYLVGKSILVDKPVSLIAKGKVEIDFERTTLFEIADGGSLELSGLTISGASAPDNVGNSVIRSSRYSMLVNYQIRIENSQFIDLDVNRHFNIVNVSKSTMADSITILNSSFSDVSGAILKLDKEYDDFGIYNAEYVEIRNSSFTNVQGAIADLYRGGTDESTFGPHFLLSGSEVRNVGKGSKNKQASSVYLHGVQVTNISDNNFVDSAPIKLFHTVGEPVSRVTGNTFAATPPPEVLELNSDKENTAMIEDNIVK